jgi:hypothetical protein
MAAAVRGWRRVRPACRALGERGRREARLVPGGGAHIRRYRRWGYREPLGNPPPERGAGSVGQVEVDDEEVHRGRFRQGPSASASPYALAPATDLLHHAAGDLRDRRVVLHNHNEMTHAREQAPSDAARRWPRSLPIVRACIIMTAFALERVYGVRPSATPRLKL